MLKNELLIEALLGARAHVYRQQHAGKHEQDRIDAVEWIEKWGSLVGECAGPELLLAALVPGDPIGKGRPRGTVRGGYVKMYTPKRTADWERAAALLVRNAWKRAPYEGPVHVEFDAVFHRPKRLLRKKDPEQRVWHVSKPDIDNVAKSGLDSLVMAGMIRDDVQCVSLQCRSMYSSKVEGPCLEVRVYSVDELP